MKILMLSMFAPHFFNWTEQLRDSGHEVYWLDIFDSNTPVKQIDFVEQIIGWRHRWDFPGRYFLKKNVPGLLGLINIVNERSFTQQLEKQLLAINPDIVHSFVMYLGGAPALPVMKKFPALKWVYSSWGSDMYYYRDHSKHAKGMRETFPHIDYMFADCQRDFQIAKEHGFKGEFLGVFPGGGGVDLKKFTPYIKDEKIKNRILIKGYQGRHGKCISVLEAVKKIKKELEDYHITVFGATSEVLNFVKTSSLKDWKNLQIYGKMEHEAVIKLMGQSLIYIGNSSSDGMPNTLLEAIAMNAFPIQSNPGGATAEIITHKINGLLINEPENTEEIKGLVLEAVNNSYLRKTAIEWNFKNIKPELVREKVRIRVLKAYEKIGKSLK